MFFKVFQALFAFVTLFPRLISILTKVYTSVLLLYAVLKSRLFKPKTPKDGGNAG